MKTRLWPLYLLMALMITACASDPVEPTDASVIVPLAVGNEWKGVIGAAGPAPVDWLLMSEKGNVTDQVMIDGETWYRTTAHNFNSPGVGVAFLKNRADGLYIRRDANDSAKLYIRYPASVGDTVMDFGEYQVTYENGALGPRAREVGILEQTDDAVTVKAGTFSCWRIRLHAIVLEGDPQVYYPTWEAGEGTLWYAPGIGPVKQGDARWEMTGYVLN